MQIIRLQKKITKKILQECSVALAKPEGVILIPTETVYGLTCCWDNLEAKKRICNIKLRPEEKPFQMLAANLKMVKKYGGIISPLVEQLTKAFCPGPLTIIVPSDDPKINVGFRIPNHKFVLDLINFLGVPLAGTSANLSRESPALDIKTALKMLKSKPDLILDGGDLPPKSKASTVIECIDTKLKIIREGPITLSDIQKKLPDIKT